MEDTVRRERGSALKNPLTLSTWSEMLGVPGDRTHRDLRSQDLESCFAKAIASLQRSVGQEAPGS
jgi:hypothetical protein